MPAMASGASGQLTLHACTQLLQTSHEVGSIHQIDLVSYALRSTGDIDEMHISQQQRFTIDSQT